MKRRNSYASIVAASRLDWLTHNEFILNDETSRSRISNASIHEGWGPLIARHPRLVILTSPDVGKSQQLTIGYSLWRAGQNPASFRCLIGSAKEDNAKKFTRSIQTHVERNKRLKMVWPGMRPGKKWTESELHLERPEDAIVKDATWEVAGAEGSKLGARFDLALLDDLINGKNTRTPLQAQKTIDWIQDTLEGRMNPGGQIVLICNAWEEYDAAHWLAREKGWYLHRSPIRDPVTGKTRWKERWPQERVEGYYGPKRRHLDCIARRSEDAIFDARHIEQCKAQGKGLTSIREMEVPPGCRIVTGVDLASTSKAISDYSALTTLLAGPPAAMGLPHLRGGRDVIRPLWCEWGRWGAAELRKRIFDAWTRYPGSRIAVESNIEKRFIEEMMFDYPQLPVIPFTTTASRKNHPEHGLGGMAVELEHQLWLLPSYEKRVDDERRYELATDPNIEPLVSDMLIYDPKDHTPDRLMSAWFAMVVLRSPIFQHHWLIGDVDAGTIVASSQDDAPGQPVVSPERQASIDAEVADRWFGGML